MSESSQIPEDLAPKHSLFNKPSWPMSQQIDNSVDLFRRPGPSYYEALAEHEEKRRRRNLKKQARIEKEDSKRTRSGNGVTSKALQEHAEGSSSSSTSKDYSTTDVDASMHETDLFTNLIKKSDYETEQTSKMSSSAPQDSRILNDFDLNDSSKLSPRAQENDEIITPSRRTAAKASDPVVRILIDSEIPDTTPLIVQRRESQRLREVRIAWCDRQNFSQDFKDSVFLTWNGNRLFDFGSCKSLIGDESRASQIMEDGFVEDGVRRLHMTAMTFEMFEEYKKREEEVITEQALPVQRTRLILRNPRYEDYRVAGKPNNTINTLLKSWRRARKVPLDIEVYLVFDGERLNPRTTIAEAGFDDLDTIDVHVKSNF